MSGLKSMKQHFDNRHVDIEFVHKHIEMDSFENFVCIFICQYPILSFNKNICIIGKKHKLGVVAYIWETINID